jgi:phosphodiesterase/alkaline phosphatase D-like protein
MSNVNVRKLFAVIVIVSILTVLVPAPVMAVPQIPMQFYGEVLIGGESASDGIVVEAKIDGTAYSNTTTKSGKYGYDPVFTVPGDDPDTPAKEGGVDGDLIAFHVGGTVCATAWFRQEPEGVELLLEVAELPAPVVAVASPNGGETWAGESERAITWVTVDTDKSTVAIDYSADGGETWNPIVSGIADTGSYTWTLPNINTSAAKIRVTATDQGGNDGSDASDANFAIDSVAPSISSVDASDITQTGASVSWSTNEPATSQVEYGVTAAYGSATSLDSTLKSSHTVSLSGLSPDTTYHYRVISDDAPGNKATSVDYTFETESGVANIVIADVSASNVTSSSAIINWSTDVAADTQVEYGLTTAYGSATGLDSSLATQHCVSLNGLSPNTTYHFRVKSSGALSDDYTFATSGETTPPAMTEITISNITVASAVITWNTDEPATTQVFYDAVSHAAGAATDYQWSTPLNADMLLSHGAGLTGLSSGITYYCKVVSKDACNNEAVSEELSFTTVADATAPTITAPAASAITTTTAVISWNTDEPATSQAAYDTASHASGAVDDYSLTTSLDSALLLSRSIGLAGLSPDTTYYYRVVSADASGNQTVSTEQSFSTLADTTQPSIAGVTESNVALTSAIILWTTNECATTRVVYDSETHTDVADYPLSAPSPADATADMTSHGVALSGLTPDTIYYYRIVVADAYGNETVSIQHSFKTEDKTAPAVSLISAVAATSTSAVIVWATDENATAQVEYGTTSATHGNYESTSALDADLLLSHGLVLVGLDTGTTYYYRVISQDASGNETVSQEYSFVTA